MRTAPAVAGHGIGAVLALRAIATEQLRPEKLVLLPNPMHTKPAAGTLEKAGRVLVRAAVVPGCDRVLARAGRVVLRPSRGDRLTATSADGAVISCAMRPWISAATVCARGPRPRGAGRAAPQPELLDAYAEMTFPVLLLWADEDAAHPLAIAEEALKLLPDAQLRLLPRTGFLIAYDDPVGVARELVSFCG